MSENIVINAPVITTGKDERAVEQPSQTSLEKRTSLGERIRKVYSVVDLLFVPSSLLRGLRDNFEMDYYPELHENRWRACQIYGLFTAAEGVRLFLYDALAVGLGLYEQKIFDRFLGI